MPKTSSFNIREWLVPPVVLPIFLVLLIAAVMLYPAQLNLGSIGQNWQVIAIVLLGALIALIIFDAARAFATLAASLDRAHAETAAVELLQRKPNYSTENSRQQFFFCNDPSFIDRFVEGLRVAGVP